MGTADLSVGAGLFYLFHSTNLKRVEKHSAGKSWRASVDDRTLISVSC